MKKSPVANAKALHLLAPDFFPLWDQNIAIHYKCKYYNLSDTKYLQFMCICKEIAHIIDNKKDELKSDIKILKIIDEFNYA